jgi:2-polyprenyl-3-methyl-5-hydroxy-6-metoxy-1,4-benzoquinol methylase
MSAEPVASTNGSGTACPCCGVVGAVVRGRFSSDGIMFGCHSCGHHHLARNGTSAPVTYNDHYTGFREDPVFGRAVQEFIEGSLRARLPSGSSILDLGCGNGAFLSAVSAAGYKARGLDTSEAAVELCRSRGLDAARGDFMDDSVARAYHGVDLVTLWDVIEHLDAPEAFVRQVVRTVRPGGWIFIKTPAVQPLSLEITRRAPRAAGALIGAPSHVQYFRQTSLTALLLRSGFSGLEWLPSRSVRGGQASGGLRKKIVRKVVAGLHRASGDGNLLVFARA